MQIHSNTTRRSLQIKVLYCQDQSHQVSEKRLSVPDEMWHIGIDVVFQLYSGGLKIFQFGPDNAEINGMTIDLHK